MAAETAALAAITEDRVPQGGWVIVDEAGQLDTRTLAALAGRAARARARMVLVGDTAQQGSVGAGGVFQALADRPDLVPAAVLSQLWRFADRDEARATIGLRRGKKTALQYHTSRGRVHDTTEAEVADFAASLVGAASRPEHHYHRPHPQPRRRGQHRDRRPPSPSRRDRPHSAGRRRRRYPGGGCRGHPPQPPPNRRVRQPMGTQR